MNDAKLLMLPAEVRRAYVAFTPKLQSCGLLAEVYCADPLSQMRTAQIGMMIMFPSPSLRSLVNEDGAVILDVGRDLMSTLNPTGAYVWERLQQGEPLESIIGALAHNTGEEPGRVDRDVREFVEDLKQKQLLPR